MSTFKLEILIAAACGALCIGASACGDGDRAKSKASSSTRTETASVSQARRTGASLKVMSTRYGRMLFDGRGRALYLFTRESGGSKSRCYGDCAAAWPPFLTSGKPHAASGAKASLLGTTRRRDGKTQVTYKGQPLYYYVTDRKPGQVTCQDVAEYGGTWLVVAPGGEAIRT